MLREGMLRDVRDTIGNNTRDTVCDTDGIVDLGQNLANGVPAAGLELTSDQFITEGGS